jgi:hypothetical protein
MSSTAFGDAQWVVPRKSHRRRAKRHAGECTYQVWHGLDVIGSEGVVGEVMLSRPDTVEAEMGSELCDVDFLIASTLIGALIPPVGGNTIITPASLIRTRRFTYCAVDWHERHRQANTKSSSQRSVTRRLERWITAPGDRYTTTSMWRINLARRLGTLDSISSCSLLPSQPEVWLWVSSGIG